MASGFLPKIFHHPGAHSVRKRLCIYQQTLFRGGGLICLHASLKGRTLSPKIRSYRVLEATDWQRLTRNVTISETDVGGGSWSETHTACPQTARASRRTSRARCLAFFLTYAPCLCPFSHSPSSSSGALDYIPRQARRVHGEVTHAGPARLQWATRGVDRGRSTGFCAIWALFLSQVKLPPPVSLAAEATSLQVKPPPLAFYSHMRCTRILLSANLLRASMDCLIFLLLLALLSYSSVSDADDESSESSSSAFHGGLVGEMADSGGVGMMGRDENPSALIAASGRASGGARGGTPAPVLCTASMAWTSSGVYAALGATRGAGAAAAAAWGGSELEARAPAAAGPAP